MIGLRGRSTRRGARAIARRGGAARRRRDAATPLPVADPPTALVVTAEAASCAARAVLSDSVSCMLAARCVPADRFPDGVPGARREPSASPMQTRAVPQRESCNASAPKPRNLRNDKYRHRSPEPASDSDSGPGADADSGPGADADSGPGADADSGPGGDHHLGNKTGFPHRTWPCPHAVPSAAARKTQGARAHPPIPLDHPGGTPSVHSGRFPPLMGGCLLFF
eukprot:scaffold122386_cov33-Phaeocystis_antarctica.AAC.1